MTSYTLIDGNNWLRRLYEEDRDISGLRSAVNKLRTELARPNNQVIFFWDGFNGNDWRKAIYPNYKSNRSNSKVDQSEFFLQIDLFRKIVENLNIPYFRVLDSPALVGSSNDLFEVLIGGLDMNLGASWESKSEGCD